MKQIICKDVSLGYSSEIIVKNLNFTINEGEYVCIIGENGVGKSTLMKTILGLSKTYSGEIIFNNNIKKTDISYLPQQSEIQKNFPASVKEIVLSGCLNKKGMRPFYNKNEKLTAEKNMQKLGIKEIEKRCYRELSGGQQQKVLLARALCAAEKIIFLDEPVTGLDPKSTEEMYKLIDKLNKEEKITIIMISHDEKSVMKNASHILQIKKENSFYGTKEEYLNLGGNKE